jgi:hypothetical protein
MTVSNDLFLKKLDQAIEILVEIAANDCSDLTVIQAGKFHRLLDRLTALAAAVAKNDAQYWPIGH